MDLIGAIQQGDEYAFEQAFIQRREKVYFYFLKKTGAEEDAKDLLQTTFLKLWQYRQSLSEDYSLDQHLFHIAKTVFIDYIRKQNKQPQLKTVDVPETGDQHLHPIYPAHSAEFETQAQLLKILHTMPELRRKVFVLHRLEGYSYKEVAELLCISVKSVDNHISKAVRQLKKEFVLSMVILLTGLFR